MNILLKEKITFLEDFFLVSIKKMSKCKFPFNNQMQTQISALIQLSPLQKTQEFCSLFLYGEWCFVKTEALHGNRFIWMEIELFWCTFIRAEFGWEFRFQRNIFQATYDLQIRYGKPSYCLQLNPSFTCNSWGSCSCGQGIAWEKQDV